jgi:Icc-related predicted phosphoesterase
MFGRSGKRRAVRNRLLFVTDMHGSETVLRKAVNASIKFEVEALILGGDLTGKILVPVVSTGDGYVADVLGNETRVSTEEEVAELEHTLRMGGRYTFRMTPAELQQLRDDPDEREARFDQAMRESLRGWFDLAAERLAPHEIEVVVISGNDDPLEIDDVLFGHPFVRCINDDVVRLRCGVEVLGFGASNPTPWNSPREYAEPVIREQVSQLADRLTSPETSIWNVHVPPHGSSLDIAPALDDELGIVYEGGQARMIPVGSVAVRELIEERQPALGLHGHVHESRASATLGRSLVANPGSEYTEGVLRAAYIELREDKPTVQFLAG